jgi:ribosomal protein S27AE
MTTEEATKAERDDEAAAEEKDGSTSSADLDEGRLGEEIDGEERWKDDETVSEKATCPECGEPVHNLRMTCPMCGHEYKDKEYDDEEAGTEFRAGAEVDDSEIGEAVKDESGKEKTAQSSSSDDDEDE